MARLPKPSCLCRSVVFAAGLVGSLVANIECLAYQPVDEVLVPPKKTLHTVLPIGTGILHVVLPTALTDFVNGLLYCCRRPNFRVNRNPAADRAKRSDLCLGMDAAAFRRGGRNAERDDKCRRFF